MVRVAHRCAASAGPFIEKCRWLNRGRPPGVEGALRLHCNGRCRPSSRGAAVATYGLAPFGCVYSREAAGQHARHAEIAAIRRAPEARRRRAKHADGGGNTAPDSQQPSKGQVAGRTGEDAPCRGNVRMMCPLLRGFPSSPGEGRGVRMVEGRPPRGRPGARPSATRPCSASAAMEDREIRAIAMKMLTAAAPQSPGEIESRGEEQAEGRKQEEQTANRAWVTPSVEAIASRTIHPWVRGRGDENSVSVVCFGPSSRPMAPIEEVAPR